MNLEVCMLGLLLLQPFAMVFAHILIVRLWAAKSPQKQFVVYNVLFQTLWAGITLAFLWNREWPKEIIAALLIQLIYSQAVTYSYFHVFNMSETARRIKLLLLIRRGEFYEGSQESYDASSMITNRLERLVQMRQIELNDKGQYQVVGGFLLMTAKIFRFYKKLLGIQK